MRRSEPVAAQVVGLSDGEEVFRGEVTRSPAALVESMVDLEDARRVFTARIDPDR